MLLQNDEYSWQKCIKVKLIKTNCILPRQKWVDTSNLCTNSRVTCLNIKSTYHNVRKLIS